MFQRSPRLIPMLIFVGLFILLPVTVCATEQQKELTIAFVPRSLGNPIFLDAFEASQKKAHELGVRLEWVAPFDFDSEDQVELIENLIRRGVDGIIASVNDEESVHRVFQKAIDQGIAVATFDADSPASGRLFHIGIDNYAAGVAIGEALVGVLQERQLAELELDTMILTGFREALNLEERIRGFLDATENQVSLNIVDILENEDTVEKSIILLEDYLKVNPDVNVIYFVGGWPFYVPSEALPNFRRWAQEGGISVGIDLFYDALLLQKEGLIHYLIGQDMTTMGSLGLELLVNYIRYGDTPPDFVQTGLEHANDSNIDRLLEIHKPWLVK
ncbi:MAG: sugar ABC transporter substrate-binding protein [Firmicutes bacterium]|nr:sugar ABC transporter substrate-binding protein [Bacillota bacterium]